MKYKWEYGQNREQEYYDVHVGKDYLCIFRNKYDRDHVIWMGHIETGGGLSPVLHDKKENDRYRKAEGLPPDASISKMRRVAVLCSNDPKRMMAKVEEAYEKGVREV